MDTLQYPPWLRLRSLWPRWQSEASGYSALTHEVGGVALLCLNDTVLDAAVQPVVAQ